MLLNGSHSRLGTCFSAGKVLQSSRVSQVYGQHWLGCSVVLCDVSIPNCSITAATSESHHAVGGHLRLVPRGQHDWRYPQSSVSTDVDEHDRKWPQRKRGSCGCQRGASPFRCLVGVQSGGLVQDQHSSILSDGLVVSWIASQRDD